jgi:TonB family protein
MNLRVSFTVACLAMLPIASFAQNASAPDDHPEDIQTRADALLHKARQLSDIRSPNAPAFRLKATFSFTGKDLEKAVGTYTEVWVSNSQWRRETVVNNWHRVEVGGPTRFWLLDNTDDLPEQGPQLPSVLSIFPSASASFTFESLSDREEMNPPAECAITKPDTRHLKLAFCFEKKTGVLVERILPEVRPTILADNECYYGSFQKIGDHWFPHEIACFEDRHRKLDARVVDLSPEPSPEPALFTPPPGAIELGNCSVKAEPPRAVNTPNPRRPFGSPGRNPRVKVSLVVDTKGKPQNVRIVDSGGAIFDKAAVSTLGSWRFKPATCTGEPIPMMITVRLDFPYL